MIKTLVVTGGLGFIGSNFIKYYLWMHPLSKIINIDKLTYAGRLDNLKEIEGNGRCLNIKMDICDPKIETWVEKSDAIVAFAAESHVDNSLFSADEFIKTNVQGTYNLLRCARIHDKRFHEVSTDEVFGDLPLDTKEKFDESTPYNPRNPYAVTKAAADNMARAFYATYGTKITISNCSNNFGPNQNVEKMLPKMITNIIEHRKVPIYGDGLNVRDWLYVTDHCRAIDMILENGKIGETYCIGGMTEDVSNLDLLRMVAEEFSIRPSKVIEFVQDRPGHDRKYSICFEKIQRELGWKPTHDFRENLKLTIEWYKKNEWYWKKPTL